MFINDLSTNRMSRFECHLDTTGGSGISRFDINSLWGVALCARMDHVSGVRLLQIVQYELTVSIGCCLYMRF